MNTIIGPGGISKNKKETKRPDIEENALMADAISIIFLRRFVKNSAVAAGSVKRAITKTIPTTRIRTITAKAIRPRSNR